LWLLIVVLEKQYSILELNNYINSPKFIQPGLDHILKLKHPLCILANKIDWKFFADAFSSYYSENRGSPGKPIRLMVGLHYLKHAFNESDESVVERFI